MSDVIFVAVVIAFFAIAMAYVRGCERIVGEDEVVRADELDANEVDATARAAESVS